MYHIHKSTSTNRLTGQPLRTCATYSLEAIEIYGIKHGIWLGMKRIAKCHPHSTSGGYDPIP